MAKEEKKHKHLDDFFDELVKTNPDKLDDAFKKYDEYTDDKQQHNLVNDIIHPAMDDFYSAFVKELDAQFEDKDAGKTHNKKKELKIAAVKGLKKHFEKVQPSILKAIEGIDDVEEQYEVLVHHYDISHGKNLTDSDGQVASFNELIEGYASNKKGKIGKLKKQFYMFKNIHAEGYMEKLGDQAINHYFSGFRPLEVGVHIKKKLEKKGIEVDDKVAWAKKTLPSFIGLYERYIKKEGREGLNKYGLKYKKEAKDEGKIAA